MNIKVLIALLATILVTVIVIIAMYFFGQERRLQNQALNGSSIPSAQPVIVFKENSSFDEEDNSQVDPTQAPSVGTENVVNISLPTSEMSKPTAYDLTFYYDPDAVEVIDIESGSIWSGSNILRKNIDNDNGRVRLAAGQGFEETMTNSRQIAKITYRPLKRGELIFTLASNSTFAYVGRDIPEQVNSGQLVINVQ